MEYEEDKGLEQPQQVEEKIKRPPRERSRYSAIVWRNVEKQLQKRLMRWDQLADIMGVSPTNISSMKSRESKMTLDTAMRIANALKVPIEILVRENREGRRWMYTPDIISENEYEILMRYQALINRNPDNAELAQRIIVNILDEFNKK